MGRQLWKSKSCMQLHENLRPFQVYLGGRRGKTKMLLRRGSLSLLKSPLCNASLETANGTVKTLKSVRKSCLFSLTAYYSSARPPLQPRYTVTEMDQQLKAVVDLLIPH